MKKSLLKCVEVLKVVLCLNVQKQSAAYKMPINKAHSSIRDPQVRGQSNVFSSVIEFY